VCDSFSGPFHPLSELPEDNHSVKILGEVDFGVWEAIINYPRNGSDGHQVTLINKQ
jgi:hypothetical protein